MKKFVIENGKRIADVDVEENIKSIRIGTEWAHCMHTGRETNPVNCSVYKLSISKKYDIPGYQDMYIVDEKKNHNGDSVYVFTRIE